MDEKGCRAAGYVAEGGSLQSHWEVERVARGCQVPLFEQQPAKRID